MRHNTIRCTLLAPLALLLLLTGCLETPPETLTPQIEPEELTSLLTVIASDKMEGRRAGTRGYERAAAYCAKVFQQVGCEPAFVDKSGEPSWFQPVPLVHVEYGAKNQIVLRTDSSNVTYPREQDGIVFIAPGHQAPPSGFNTPIFVGYGIEEPEYGWDDYEGLDLEGKIVAVLHGEPYDPYDFPLLPDSIRHKYQGRAGLSYGLSYAKRGSLQKRGVAGVLVLPGSRLLYSWGIMRYHEYWFDLFPGEDIPERPADPTYPIIALPQDAARSLFNPELFDPIEREGEVVRGPMEGVQVEWQWDVKRTQQSAPNVAAVVRGTDPVLQNEWIVALAHLDHLGVRDGAVYNGANDNGSGSVAVLETAGAIAANPSERSVLFLLSTAEEVGFWGTQYFVAHSTISTDQIIAAVNFDEAGMLTQASAVEAIGDRLFEVPLQESAHIQQLPEPRFVAAGSPGAGIFHRSDHYNFHRVGIPSLFLWTGEFVEYHSTVDDVDRINFTVLTQSTMLLEGLVRSLANEKL